MFWGHDHGYMKKLDNDIYPHVTKHIYYNEHPFYPVLRYFKKNRTVE